MIPQKLGPSDESDLLAAATEPSAEHTFGFMRVLASIHLSAMDRVAKGSIRLARHTQTSVRPKATTKGIDRSKHTIEELQQFDLVLPGVRTFIIQ